MDPSSIVPQADQDQTRSTMMAWRVHEFGPPNVMKFEQVPRPNPGPGEILVKVEAASVPVISVTAWQALFDHAQLKAGQTVVIHGAAGNVGAYAVQLACRAGVRTIATVGTDDIPFVRNLGANTVVDYRTQRFEEE